MLITIGAKRVNILRARGRHFLIWPQWVCASQQGMVFRVIRLKTGYTISLFSVLNRVSFSTGSLEPYMWVPALF